jgi:hypothetical protein
MSGLVLRCGDAGSERIRSTLAQPAQISLSIVFPNKSPIKQAFFSCLASKLFVSCLSSEHGAVT